MANLNTDLIYAVNLTGNASSTYNTDNDTQHLSTFAIKAIKFSAMFLVGAAALVGNALVIISVLWFLRLRSVITNYFIVSMAFADLLVAVLVMPFSASKILIDGRWMFGRLMCDIFNSNDVLFSTASITHLCCISMDRYIAILNPLHYASIITPRRVAGILTLCWVISATISYVPVHTGLYSTPEYLKARQPETCPWLANMSYVLISSTISFWIPLIIMCIIYLRIFIEAGKQEKKMYRLMKMTESSQTQNVSHQDLQTVETGQPCDNRDTAASTRERKRIRREHKAAKTLSLIMGCFAMCWLPFFIWYAISVICTDSGPYPDILVDILFWIGYSNSALNPIIYGLRNREFKQAFAHLLGLRKCLYKDRRDWRGESEFQDVACRTNLSPPKKYRNSNSTSDYQACQEKLCA